MVINDEVVFIPIPKNASWSVEDTCIEYGFNLKYPNVLWENSIKHKIKNPYKHIHSSLSYLTETFGINYDFVCIIRDSTDRFISAWKYFIQAMVEILPENDSKKIKNLGNEFVISFFIENIDDFKKSYYSIEIRIELLIKLLNKMNVIGDININDEFKKRYAIHILSFVSQYQWIQSSGVKVKQFRFDNLNEFENYLSNKLNTNFKLIHKNKTKLDYSGVSKTKELIDFVDKYIDGSYKRELTLI